MLTIPGDGIPGTHLYTKPRAHTYASSLSPIIRAETNGNGGGGPIRSQASRCLGVITEAIQLRGHAWESGRVGVSRDLVVEAAIKHLPMSGSGN